MTGDDDAGASVRRLIRTCDRAVLATALAGGTAWPYASLVLTACDHGAAPLLLLSDLADHTRNLKQDGRASLLFDGTAGLADPLAGNQVDRETVRSGQEVPAWSTVPGETCRQ